MVRRAHLEAVAAELERRRRRGEEAVYVSEDTLEALRAEVARNMRSEKSTTKATEDSPEPSSAVAPASASPSPPKEKPVPMASNASPSGAAPLPSEPPVVELPDGDKRARWDWLRERVLADPVCREHVRPGKQVVFGVGNIDADIFFCGEAPGAEEEEQGEPFVGRAGQLLTKMIGAMGLAREEVYIGNIMNWRPEMADMRTGNRPPTQEEMAWCLPFLRAQIRVVQPKVIVALGGTAVNGLLGYDPKRRMGQVRGHWHEFEGTALMITFHPSYLLRNGSLRNKRTVWEDLLQVMEKAALPISEKQRGYFLQQM